MDLLWIHLSSDFDSNILVCDELFDGLDSIGCNKVVDLIANLTNITSIYITR